MSARGWGVSRRRFLAGGVAAVASGMFRDRGPAEAGATLSSAGDVGRICHAKNGTPQQNVARVFQMAYGGIANFIGPEDIVLLRPSLQWARNGYTNTEIGKALIDLILNRPGGFAGEIIVIENQHRSDPHANPNSGWCTEDKLFSDSLNWFELIQYYVDNQDRFPSGIHRDPVTGQINVTFQFLVGEFIRFALADPHPILTTYGGLQYEGASEALDSWTNPFMRLKYAFPQATCYYVRRPDLRYTSSIARTPEALRTEYEMSYPVFKSQHSGLYVSYFKGHPAAWNPATESYTSHPVKLINMAALNHHGPYAAVTSVVKGHFGMAADAFHHTGWDGGSSPTFYYAGGAIGYWMAAIRRPDLHMSCAEYVGRTSSGEPEPYRTKSVAISTDPVALDYYVGRQILFPSGGPCGLGGIYATDPSSNDPSLETGYYRLTLDLCRDPLNDHSIINGTLNESEMAVYVHDFSVPYGDLDVDGDVDLADFRRYQACFNGPNRPLPGPQCASADSDGDADADLRDFTSFMNCFNGPNRPPRCLP